MIRREARCSCEQGNRDEAYVRLMHMAEAHVEACGASWAAYRDAVSRELAELLEL